MSAREGPVRVLVVCTGNVCRSPMTERLLSSGLNERGAAAGIEVHSAGTAALVGRSMTPETSALLAAAGGEAADFAARSLSRAMVSDADLVLALTRRHRAAVVSLHPRANRYTFTLREVQRLLPLVGELPGEDPAERMRALPGAVAARRGFAPVPEPAVDDVIDPYRRGTAVYEQMAGEVLPAVRAIVDAVAPR